MTDEDDRKTDDGPTADGETEGDQTDDQETDDGETDDGETDDRADLLEELDHLKVDLALKDSYAMELSAALTERDQEVAALKPALEQCQQLVAAQDAELAKLRAAVVQAQVKLEEVTSRAGYRLLVRASDTLERHDRLRRTVTAAARRLNRSR